MTKFKTLRPTDETQADLSKVASKVWNARQGDFEKQRVTLQAKLVESRVLKSELLKSKLRGEVGQQDYEESNAEFVAEIAALEDNLRSIDSAAGKLESFIRFVELCVTDMAEVWKIANLGQRQRVQNLLFSDGLSYSMNEGF